MLTSWTASKHSSQTPRQDDVPETLEVPASDVQVPLLLSFSDTQGGRSGGGTSGVLRLPAYSEEYA